MQRLMVGKGDALAVHHEPVDALEVTVGDEKVEADQRDGGDRLGGEPPQHRGILWEATLR